MPSNSNPQTKEDAMKFPSVKLLAACLKDINKQLDDECEIRLQVYPSGDWAVRVGDPCYDLDHHGFWGAGMLDGGDFDALAEARELVEQAKDQEAMSSC
jgi:hypothetical protein